MRRYRSNRGSYKKLERDHELAVHVRQTREGSARDKEHQAQRF